MKYLLVIYLIIATRAARGQQKVEGLHVDWPADYKWKVIDQQDKNGIQLMRIIPGNDTKANPSIIGAIAAYSGVKFSNTDEMIQHYQSGLDTGTTLTVMEKNNTTKNIWVLFKVETPVTKKYPEPESDLYYVIQGEYALYENNVAIKSPSLSKEFVEKWTGIFKTARITFE